MKKIYTTFVFLFFFVNLTFAQCNLTFTPPATSICSGSCATITVSGANTYAWLPGPLNGSTVTLCPVVTTTYTVMGTDVSSNTCSATFLILVNPEVTPTFNPIGPLCQNSIPPTQPLSSTNIPPITGTWNAPISTTTSGTTFYTFTPTVGACATTATMSIIVNPQITPTFAAIGPLCQNSVPPTQPLSSTNIPPITGTWNAPISTTTSGTTFYTFTPTVGACATTATMSIVIDPQMTPPFNPVAPICSGAYLAPLPTTSIIYGFTGTWAPALNNTATTTYTFTPTGGQCATNATLTITVNPNVIPFFMPVAPINYGDPLTALPTMSNNGITGTWVPALNNTATTTYTFTPAAGQCATTTTLTIVVNPNAIDENIAAEALVVYPNPASERLFINFDELNAVPKTLKLFNALGQVCFETNMPLQTNVEGINVANMDPGTYNLQIVFENGTVNRTVIVN